MKSVFTKKVLVIVSIVAFVAIAAIVIAFTTGNINYPGLSNPDEVFYQRLDNEGNVVYSVTNEELFEEIKGNDGIQQLLFLTDTFLLANYITNVTNDEVVNKLLELTYGTSDAEIIAELTVEQRDTYSDAFAQTMSLAGFTGIEDDYAKLMVARENYAYDFADEEGLITENNVISEYLNGYFDDISALKIRFTSKADAEFVMQKFNLVSIAGIDLRLYNGYAFNNETLLDLEDKIIEAYLPVDIYYLDGDDNILNMNDDIIYTLGVNGIYTDTDDLEYRIEDATGNLIDGLLDVVIENEMIFDNLAAAKVYEDANIVYYTVTRTDAYDMNEIINVVNSNDEIKFTIDSDGHIWDEANNDVTHTTDLVVNKVYQVAADVKIVSSNNSTELTDQETLAKYIEMYNYVYGNYRTELDGDATIAELIASDDENLHFNFDDLSDINAAVANYLFNTLAINDDDDRYSNLPIQLSSTSSYYYMAYKLEETVNKDIISTIFDYLEPTVIIPSTIGGTIALPSTTYYDGTIAWGSDNSDIISSKGVVVNPTVDTEVELTFTLNVFGKTKSFTRTVTVLAAGDTEVITEAEWTEVSLKTILNDNVTYDLLYHRLLEDYVNGTNGTDNVSKALLETRADLGFVIYDRYLGLDYQALDSTFKVSSKGDKDLICSFEKTLTTEETYEVTADQLFTYALSRNAAIYTLYAAQDKELLNSTFFTDIFGEQTNLVKNKTDRMDKMYLAINNAKSEYVYYKSLYASMGSAFGYSSFTEYAYARYGVKSEIALLQYFVSSELQPHLIQETTELYDVVEALYPEIQDYYENYFSLNVNQVLIHIDFDEDGNPDDYDKYKDEMTVAETEAFNALLGPFENAILDFQGTFAELVKEYNDASREDETWGEFKQNGFLIMTENLNTIDDDDVSHSLTYSGKYGVKDTYAAEFVDSLIELYQEYQLTQNLDKDSLTSELVETVFGLHLIEVGKGDDFDKPSCKFTEEDPSNPEYSVGAENDNEMPSLEQIQLYASYKYYAMVYDLTDADVETKYGIVIPTFPSTVNTALVTYFDDLLSSTYVLGTVNINIADRLAGGQFETISYTNLDNAALIAMLKDVRDVYFDAILGDYITE